MRARRIPLITAALASACAGLAFPNVRALAAEASGAPGAAVSSDVRIDQVEILGSTQLAQEAVENALELGPGDRLDRRKVVKTAENLQALYRSRGFEQVRIRTELVRQRPRAGEKARMILQVTVDEGRPTRIAEVQLLPDESLSAEARKQWREMSGDFLLKIGLNPGDVLSQEALATAKRTLQDLLVGKEFVGAKVESALVEGATPGPAVERLPTAKWMKLELRVRPGDRVSFGFRGNSVFPLSKLLAFVDEQRVIGFGKDYVGAIRSRIEDEYRALGYGQVKVEPFTFEKSGSRGGPALESAERHVTYMITEGPRMRIASVDFDGNRAFTNEQLRKEFQARATSLIQAGYYSERDLQRTAEYLVEWMKSRGYLSAKLVSINSTPLPKRKAGDPTLPVKVTIYLYEWDQTIVQSVNVQGNRAIPEAEVKAILGVQENVPLNLFAFSEGIDSLKVLYRNKGYLDVRIANEGSDQVVRYSGENRYADISLDIDEGHQYRAGQIVVDGLTATREEIVRRELRIEEGGLLEESRLAESEARLRRLGIFSVVSLRLTEDPDREGFKTVRISLQEGVPGVMSGGVGFRNDMGIRAFGGISYGNLMGKNHSVALDAEANRRLDENFRFAEFKTQLAYVWPWFADLKELTFRPVLSWSRQQYLLFSAETVSAAASWEKQLYAFPRLTGLFSYSIEKIHQFDAKKFKTLDNQELTIGAITPALRLDLRDNPLAPTSGLFATASLEIATPFLGSSGEDFPIGYTRFQVRADQFIPLWREASLYLSFRTGIARSTEAPVVDANGVENPKSGALPVTKQFALGGAGSLRGFQEQELNHQDVFIRGIETYVNYRFQLDLPFAGALRFGPFVDAANLQFDTYSLGRLRFGAGLGFHYQTPVGPVNLDWGFKLDRRPEDKDFSALYFSIGII